LEKVGQLCSFQLLVAKPDLALQEIFFEGHFFKVDALGDNLKVLQS
jgi:hypothetical protein